MAFWEKIRLGLEEVRQRLPKKTSEPSSPNKKQTTIGGLKPAFLLALVPMALYALAVIPNWSIAHIDLGDGNYLYTAGRLADGLMIYRDFLSPQPPLHILTGAGVIRLGRWLAEMKGYSRLLDMPLPLLAVRAFSLCLHLLTCVWIFLLGRRFSKNAFGGTVAVALYLILPLGFWWSLGYQSEPLEMFFLLGSLVFFLQFQLRPMALAGFLMACATLTNMTAAPYALACLTYLFVRHLLENRPPGRSLFWVFFLPLVGVFGLTAGIFEWVTGAYFENVWSNQMASYPPEGFWGYGFPKILRESFKVLGWESSFILIALLGLIQYTRSEESREREFLVWYAMVLLGSIGFVSKGGTMDYIFTIGEPVVALFGAVFLTAFFRPATFARFLRIHYWRDTSWFPLLVFLVLFVLVLAAPSLRFNIMVLQQQQYEQDDRGVMQMISLIRRHSEPDQAILCPPYYAFISDRLLVEEYSELYLWSMKYVAEQREGKPGKGTEKVERIAAALSQKKVPLVVANVDRPMLLISEPVRQALQANYRPLFEKEDLIQTMNFRLQAYVPKK